MVEILLGSFITEEAVKLELQIDISQETNFFYKVNNPSFFLL